MHIQNSLRNKKRRSQQYLKKQQEFDEILGNLLDSNGFLDVQTFIKDDFDWFNPLNETLGKLNINSPDQGQEYSLNLSTLELCQVLKHRRLSPEPEAPQASTSSSQESAQDPDFKTPKPRCRKFIFKPFKRNPQGLDSGLNYFSRKLDAQYFIFQVN